MILSKDPDTGYYTYIKNYGTMTGVHDVSACADHDCAIHNHPSEHALVNAPMNWREDRGILERICEHYIGHPDHDSAKYLASVNQSYQNIHGCDGCCWGVSYATVEESKANAYQNERGI